MMNDEPQATFWSLSFEFGAWDQAGNAYEQCRDTIFGLDVNASAYRIRLGDHVYVVVVGPGFPTESLVDQLHFVCHQGESTSVPGDVVLALALRHAQFRANNPRGTKFEHRELI